MPLSLTKTCRTYVTNTNLGAKWESSPKPWIKIDAYNVYTIYNWLHCLKACQKETNANGGKLSSVFFIKSCEEIRGWGFSQSNLGLSFFWSNLGLSFARNSFCGNYCWFMKILGLKSMPGAGISFQSNPLKEKLVFLSQKGFHGVSWNFTS